MILTQSQVADIFDVQVAAVSKMYKRGMPALPEKVNGKIAFNSKEIIDWYTFIDTRKSEISKNSS